MGIDLDLSRRAVAAGWKWQAGALDETGYRAISEVGDGLWQLGRRDCMGNLSARPMLPDFRDPATRGCLLEMVREAWDDPGLHIQGQYHAGQWRWRFRGGHPHGGTFNRAADVWYETEESALVAALEAAGRK